MFGSESDSRAFSGGLFVIQLFTTPLLIVIFGGFLTLVTTGSGTDSIGRDIVYYMNFSIVGLAYGYAFQTAAPSARASGGAWIWVPPVGILLWGILDMINRFHRFPREYFISIPGDEGLGILFITLPAVACCFYSTGVVIASRPAGTVMGKSFRKAVARSPIQVLAEKVWHAIKSKMRPKL